MQTLWKKATNPVGKMAKQAVKPMPVPVLPAVSPNPSPSASLPTTSTPSKELPSDIQNIEKFDSMPSHISVQPVSNLFIPGTIVDNTVLNEHMSLFYAYIRSGEPLSAELLLQKLYRYNYGNFREKCQMQPLNDLLESYLQIDTLFDQKVDYDKASKLYKSLSKFNLKPNMDTFALMTAHYVQEDKVSNMKNLIIDMHQLNLKPCHLIHHPRFKNPIDLANLAKLMNKCGHSIDNIVQDAKTDSLLMSALQEAESIEILSDSIDTQSDLIKINPSSSPNIALLEKMLEKFKDLKSDKDMYKVQETLERESQMLALLEKQDQIDALPQHLQKFTGLSLQLIQGWYAAMLPYIKSELKHPSINKKYQPYLKLLKPEKLALITITCFLNVPKSRDIKGGEVMGRFTFASLTTAIGKQIEKESNAQYLAKKVDIHSRKYQGTAYDLHKHGKLTDPRVRKTVMEIARLELERNNKWLPAWPDDVAASVGASLASMLIFCAKIKVKKSRDASYTKSDTVSAFTHSIISLNKKCIGIVQYNDELLRQLLAVETRVLPKFLPMLVPPRPWITWKSGGYLTDYSKAEMTRIGRHPQHRQYMEAADSANHMATLYHALDCLGSTAWNINKSVLEVAKWCWNTGKEWPSIPSGVKIPTPSPLSSAQEEDPALVKKFKEMKRKALIDEQNRFSQRCDSNYKILIADSFRDEVIYFPHFLDFRGRAYPIPQYLNHIGNDLCRGLLTFAHGKPLGERGLKWLKIQLANLYGVDKISFSERERFVEENLDSVFDSADKPIKGRMWWMKADSPWQCLATCIELSAALRSTDPTKYVSKLPIHQDGTCNGLQHYAALGGDIAGAKLVNLVPGVKPGDVYTGVALKVAELIAKDAENNLNIAIKLNGLISRKMVKQTVMTNTYGVTKMGAKVQVFNRLKEIKELNMSNFELDEAARYITEKIFATLEHLFEGARNLQNWLTDAAKVISRSIPLSDIPEKCKQDIEFFEKRGLIEKSRISEVDEDETPFANATDTDSELVNAALDEFSLTNEYDIKENTPEEELIREKVKKDSKIEKTMRMSSVVWTSPLGLPVVQPYWNHNTKKVQTTLQSITLYDFNSPCAIDSRKQTMAFPPNFVHSLDAAHMQLSAIACKSANIDFAAVHDSYWTHACDVDRMSMILREAFIRLHSEDLMERLRDELMERYKNNKVLVPIQLEDDDVTAYLEHRKKHQRKGMKFTNGAESKKMRIYVWKNVEIPPLPAKGSFNIEIVKNSPYFFH